MLGTKPTADGKNSGRMTHFAFVKFSESEASNHTPSLVDFTTTTPELKFSVHTGSWAQRASMCTVADMISLDVICWSPLKLAHDGLDRELKFFN
jgi:hypothetical protein